MLSSLLAAMVLPAAAQTPSAPPDVALSTPPALTVIWPKDGEAFPFVERSFTFGSASPGSTLTVNGIGVPVEEDGAFFAMVPFSSGAFTLDYAAEWRGVALSTQRVLAVGPPHGLPETGPDEIQALEPAYDRDLRAGDVVVVRCKGPPGLPAHFDLKGLARDRPMAEAAGPVPGLYEGHYVVRPEDRAEAADAVCSLRKGVFSSLEAKAPGKITVAPSGGLRTAETTAKQTVLRTLPGGYSLFFPPGIRLEVTGTEGRLFRVALSEHEEGYVDAWRVRLLPEGTPPPRGVIGRYLHTEVSSSSVRLVIEASERLPFEVTHAIEPLGFHVRFFGASHRFDRIRYETGDPVVREVRWRQESARTVLVAVDTHLRWGWGYDAYYDEKGRFILEIRRPPALTGTDRVLAGRRVVVDPGHGPEESATGPRGLVERDLNLSVSLALERLLKAEGADVYMIRTSSDGPSLIDRPALAWEARGDVYVSVHHNAFPVTADPFERPRGYMNFYYQPHSRPLVEAVHASYRRSHPELADESVQWGDLHVCRATQMPSILTESAYVILPEQEKRLMEPAYRERLARTILEGLRGYYKAYRSIQRRSPAERRAARE